MRTLCKHIFASAERKFNTVIPSLGDTLRTLMQECFKNIKWRDVDKKIRLLEFYVFGNVTVVTYWRIIACESSDYRHIGLVHDDGFVWLMLFTSALARVNKH